MEGKRLPTDSVLERKADKMKVARIGRDSLAPKYCSKRITSGSGRVLLSQQKRRLPPSWHQVEAACLYSHCAGDSPTMRYRSEVLIAQA